MFVSKLFRFTLLSLCIVFFIFELTSCGVPTKSQQVIKINDTTKAITMLLFSDDFENGLSNWVIENEKEGEVAANGNKMDIDAAAGSTVWFKEKLEAPLLIQYDAVVIGKGGPNDRVSDLNCFWLAEDPMHPTNFFTNSAKRKGKFENYDSLKLYYVGLGGHDNSKTRFRRYDGKGNKPLLPEHDLAAEEFLIKANTVNTIRIIVYKGIVQYYRNGKIIYNFADKNPYQSGYFGFRTTRNHMTLSKFRVYSLK
jgi:hypothetical protein